MNKTLVLILFCLMTQTFAFKLSDINNKVWLLEDLKGKWVLVNFWATWCPPCLKEMPFLNQISKDHSDIIILGINHWDNVGQKALNDFINLYQINYAIIDGRSNQASLSYFANLHGLPTTFIYDTNGKLVREIRGEVNKEKLIHIIPQLKSKKSD